MNKLKVNLDRKTGNSYEIYIGEKILDRVGMILARNNWAERYIIVTDTRIDALHGERVQKARDKTSILFGTPHVPGALQRALTPFAEAELNLLRIESFPMRDRMREYLFFADFAGHIAEEKTQRCLEKLTGQTAVLKVLGSYPRGEELP